MNLLKLWVISQLALSLRWQEKIKQQKRDKNNHSQDIQNYQKVLIYYLVRF